MKTDFKYIEDEMNSLAESMVEIRLFSSEIDNELRDIRTSTRKLMTTADNLQKVSEILITNDHLFFFSWDICHHYLQKSVNSMKKKSGQRL